MAASTPKASIKFVPTNSSVPVEDSPKLYFTGKPDADLDVRDGTQRIVYTQEIDPSVVPEGITEIKTSAGTTMRYTNIANKIK